VPKRTLNSKCLKGKSRTQRSSWFWPKSRWMVKPVFISSNLRLKLIQNITSMMFWRSFWPRMPVDFTRTVISYTIRTQARHTLPELPYSSWAQIWSSFQRNHEFRKVLMELLWTSPLGYTLKDSFGSTSLLNKFVAQHHLVVMDRNQYDDIIYWCSLIL
jgi:hypothetical protein